MQRLSCIPKSAVDEVFENPPPKNVRFFSNVSSNIQHNIQISDLNIYSSLKPKPDKLVLVVFITF